MNRRIIAITAALIATPAVPAFAHGQDTTWSTSTTTESPTSTTTTPTSSSSTVSASAQPSTSSSPSSPGRIVIPLPPIVAREVCGPRNDRDFGADPEWWAQYGDLVDGVWVDPAYNGQDVVRGSSNIKASLRDKYIWETGNPANWTSWRVYPGQGIEYKDRNLPCPTATPTGSTTTLPSATTSPVAPPATTTATTPVTPPATTPTAPTASTSPSSRLSQTSAPASPGTLTSSEQSELPRTGSDSVVIGLGGLLLSVLGVTLILKGRKQS